MRKATQIAALVLLTAGLVLGTSGAAAAKTVSDKKYAKSLCGSIQGVSDTIDQIQPTTGGDPAAKQTQMLASTDQRLESLKSAKAKAAKISPDGGGKKITKIFNQYFQSNIDGITAARDSSRPQTPATLRSRRTSLDSRPPCRPWTRRPATRSPSCRPIRTCSRR